MEVLFVAPHPDDVCFSVGGLAASTVAAKHLVSVFSQSAWSEPSWTGGRSAEAVTAAKRSEDLAFASVLGFEYHALGLPDPTLRRPPSPKGPVHHCRQKAKDDPQLQATAEEGLLRLLDEHHFDVVVGPLGAGKHRDHVLCNQAVRRVTRSRDVPVVYYEDLPYSNTVPLWRIALRARRVGLGLTPFLFRSAVRMDAKVEMASLYRSQYSPVILQALRDHSRRLSEWGDRRDPRGSSEDAGLVVERLWLRRGSRFPDGFLGAARPFVFTPGESSAR